MFTLVLYEVVIEIATALFAYANSRHRKGMAGKVENKNRRI